MLWQKGSAVMSNTGGFAQGGFQGSAGFTGAPLTLIQLGGIKVYVQAAAPTGTIPVNSIWINTTNGSINNWNGSGWVQQEFNAQNLIQAGTIVAALIEANTITASQIAANTITGAQIAAQTISGIYLGASFTGLNMIADPQFNIAAVNTARLADPAVVGAWSLTGGTAEVTASATTAELPLMPSISPAIWVNPGEQYYLSVTIANSASANVGMGILCDNGAFEHIHNTFTGTQTLTGAVTIPAGAHYGYIYIFSTATAGTPTSTFSAPYCTPAVLTGENFIINGNGTFTYSGTPALGNLTASIASAGGTDSFGNLYLPGTVGYFQTGGTWYATQFGTIQGVAFYSAGTAGGPWVEVASITAGPDVVLNSNRYVTANNPLIIEATPLTPVVAGYAAFYGNSNGTPTANTPGGVGGALPLTQTDSGIASGNVTSPTLITSAYTLDSALTPGSTYTIKLWFNGTWGAQVLSIYADISGATTALAGVAAAFAAGAANGDSVNGWIELEVYVASTTTCRCSVSGGIHDQTVAANNSDTAGCIITGTVATGVAIAGGDTLGIAIKFAASVVGQTIISEGARFTRSGN